MCECVSESVSECGECGECGERSWMLVGCGWEEVRSVNNESCDDVNQLQQKDTGKKETHGQATVPVKNWDWKRPA